MIEGEAEAVRFLERLRAQQTEPGELAQFVSVLQADELQGFSRVLEKALGLRHA